ncbi:MAG: IS30 family transposase [Tannerella sp.]|jgi:IS30 family transposase|nr:IS30 family transposase [Tannerella sp.]
MKKVHLIPEQRYTISAMLGQGCTQKQIAEAIGKDKSVVSRELKRNANPKGKYSFGYARDMADLRKERMKQPRKLHPWLQKKITGLIMEGWSPRQIEGRLKIENKPFVSHETIYQLIRRDKAAGGTLYRHTRHKLKHRKRPAGKKVSIKNRVTIDQRPKIVDTKERFGDWEIDTIVGENNKGAIVTMVERKTAFMMMEKLKHGKNAKELTKTVTRMLFAYREHVHTITGDNGTEFADHQNIAKVLKTQFFFTRPYSSWEKGLIENTNKLIRQYIPKKTNFNKGTSKISFFIFLIFTKRRSPLKLFKKSLQSKSMFLK